MKFQDYEHTFHPKRWGYLNKDINDFGNYSIIYLNEYIWSTGNGDWEGYCLSINSVYWDENLIYYEL